MWAFIERGNILMHCRNITFTCHDEFSKYMKVEGATLENVFDYLFDDRVGKFLSEKGKRYLHVI